MKKIILLAMATLLFFSLGCGKFQKYTAQNVVDAISKSGLSIESVKDQQIGGSAAPATEVESKEFIIKSISPNGGQILVFKDKKGLDSMKEWFDKFPDLAPYVYVKGNVILQLNSGLPVSEAEKYKETLNKLN